ncbi:DUF3788 family protein [Clostridium sp. WB02_MRS01]|uniref:DUF3788 family protein n=1 Tax=Clostridium sp. WB02_MRS01 TaxID=2605777 RepID=UPI00257053CD|nr:DUF3788 family protein [Clostridium sp. WB02_MRS01]
MMYERMIDKSVQPEISDIERHIGLNGCRYLQFLEDAFMKRYNIQREIRFPFGNTYGWGYKYSHKTKHLCYLFFEKDAITITLQIGDREVPLLNQMLPTFSSKTQSLWEHRYLCGENGGWVHVRILSEDDLDDAIKLIEIRKKPRIIQN